MFVQISLWPFSLQDTKNIIIDGIGKERTKYASGERIRIFPHIGRKLGKININRASEFQSRIKSRRS